ncbi:MAG: lytic transglycosylase domain-containing protein [Nitrospirae bacterium]|nr:lytic transglycosylase domain-containing protein [Nitrospirota bacterium]
MKSFARHIVSLIAFLASLSGTAQADIYQFIDDSGVVHFTNVPSGRVKKTTKVHAEARGPASSSAAARPAPTSTGSRRTEDIPVSYVNIINSACERYGVDPSLVHAIVKVESDFNPFAISRKGAMGLMQLMPQTASTMNVRNTFSPHENIEGGVKYLRYLLDRYEGNLSLSLAAYNSGETSVKKWGTIPPYKETQDYVKKIMQLYNGTGKTFAPRYTIYVGTNADGTILLTDNPSNHPDKQLHRKMGQSL